MRPAGSDITREEIAAVLLLNSARTEVDLELGARLLAADRRARGGRPDGGDAREG